MLKQQPRLSASVTVSAATLSLVRTSIHGCEHCSKAARFPMAEILFRLTGIAGDDYCLPEDIHCPWCMTPIDDQTFVELPDGLRQAAVPAFASR